MGRLSGLAWSARIDARIWCDVKLYAGLRVKTAFRFSSSIGKVAAWTRILFMPASTNDKTMSVICRKVPVLTCSEMSG